MAKGGGGSQLSQLKSALSHAGLTGNNSNNNNKKRKRSGTGAPQEKDKDKRAAKLDEIQRKLNPFDVKITKLKHDVGGRKLKGVVGKPAQSKMAGIEQRKKTLLKEYQDKHRTGGILDRRFGENDPSMSLEERMLERFTKERQRASSSRGAFNLEDDEDELTHYGQSLSKLDDFDDIRDDDEDDEEDREDVKRTHFGGFNDDNEEEEDGEPARKKSKAEVMAEVIAKSKDHKLRRQIEKEQGENLRHELDQTFDSIRSLLYAPDPSATGSNSMPLGLPIHTASTTAEADKETTQEKAKEKTQTDYDLIVRSLAFEKRAKPKDRTKTEEELALEEKQALEKAERKRRKRMLGLEDSEDEDDDEGGKGKRREKRKRGGDDLEDDFDDEEIGFGMGLGLEGENESEGEGEGSDEDDEDEGDDEEGDEDDEDEEDEEEGSDDNKEGEGGEEDLIEAPSKKPATAVSSSRKLKAKDLPYTFPCPSSHAEFLSIVDNIDEEKDLSTVVQRIRALYHTSLAPENKFKLQTLTGVLIDHILYLSSPSPGHVFPTTTISSLLPHLSALTKSYPIQSAEHFNRKLVIMHKNLKRGLSQSLSPSNTSVNPKTFPGPPELTLLRLISTLFPTSDLNHAVVSPARVLMGSYLGLNLSRIRSLSNLASGLFLCTLWLEYEKMSKRYVPEAVNFLGNAVLFLAPSRYRGGAKGDLPGSFPIPDFGEEWCKGLMLNAKGAKGLIIQKPDFSTVLLTNSDSDDAEASKLSLLALALDLIGRYADMLKGLEAFVEIFEPIRQILENLNLDKFGDDIQTRRNSTTQILSRLLKFSLQSHVPLLLQAHKAIPIPTYVPKFDSTSSSYLKHQDPDRERNEAAKLRSEYKKERKGAIRELRKDARFLAGVEQAKQKEKDRGYQERMKRVFGSLESERAEEKAMDREKAKEKKRAGRK